MSLPGQETLGVRSSECRVQSSGFKVQVSSNPTPAAGQELFFPGFVPATENAWVQAANWGIAGQGVWAHDGRGHPAGSVFRPFEILTLSRTRVLNSKAADYTKVA